MAVAAVVMAVAAVAAEPHEPYAQPHKQHKAAGARTVLFLGSSSALNVIVVSFHGFIVATW